MLMKIMSNKYVLKFMSIPFVMKMITAQMKAMMVVQSLFSRKKKETETEQGQPPMSLQDKMLMKIMSNKVVIKVMSIPIVMKIITAQMKAMMVVQSLFSRKKKETAVRNCWDVEIKGQQHNIEIQSNRIVGIFNTGGGRLLVDGEIVRDWGCNPFTVIPKGRLDIEFEGKKVWILTKQGFINDLLSVLDVNGILTGRGFIKDLLSVRNLFEVNDVYAVLETHWILNKGGFINDLFYVLDEHGIVPKRGFIKDLFSVLDAHWILTELGFIKDLVLVLDAQEIPPVVVES